MSTFILVRPRKFNGLYIQLTWAHHLCADFLIEPVSPTGSFCTVTCSNSGIQTLATRNRTTAPVRPRVPNTLYME